MTAYLQIGDHAEEIALQENTFCVGIESHDGNGNNLFAINALMDHYPCYKIKRNLPQGGTVALLCYTHTDPTVREILERYRDLPMVEISEPQYKLTVII